MPINELCEAAGRNDLDQIKDFITNQKTDPNENHSEHHTPPIAWACQKGHKDAITLLIELGAKVNYQHDFRAHHLLGYVCDAKNAGEICDILFTHHWTVDLNEKIITESCEFAKYPLIFYLVKKENLSLLMTFLKMCDSTQCNPAHLITSFDKTNKMPSIYSLVKKSNCEETQLFFTEHFIVRTLLTADIHDAAALKKHLSLIKPLLEFRGKNSFANLVDEHVKKITFCYENMSTFFVFSSKTLPKEIIESIFQLCFSFENIQENMQKELFHLFLKLIEAEEKQFSHNRLDKIAKLSSHQLRHNVGPLFFFHTTSSEKKDIPNCIRESLIEKIPPQTISRDLIEMLVKKISGLTDQNSKSSTYLNTPNLLRVIDAALKEYDQKKHPSNLPVIAPSDHKIKMPRHSSTVWRKKEEKTQPESVRKNGMNMRKEC